MDFVTPSLTPNPEHALGIIPPNRTSNGPTAFHMPQPFETQGSPITFHTLGRQLTRTKM